MLERDRVAAVVAEFLGAGVLTLLVLSVQRSTIGVPFFVAAAAGLTLAMAVFTLGPRGFFNPAITLGLWTLRRLSSLNAVLYIVAQFLGALGAYYLYTYFVKNDLQSVGGNFSGRIMVAEAVGAAVLGLGVAAAIYRGLSSAVTASFAGLSLMLGMIAASPAAIGLLNPAVALGAKAWVWGTYVLGPVLGAVIGINLYALLFAPGVTTTAASSTAVASTAKKRPSAKKKTRK